MRKHYKHPQQQEITTMTLRAPGNYDTKAASDECGLTCPEPTLTEQHREAEANINNIVAQYAITGELPTQPGGGYVDLTALPTDYREAVELIRAGLDSIEDLPEGIRALAPGDPSKILRMIATADQEELTRLGLLKLKETPPNDANPNPINQNPTTDSDLPRKTQDPK